MVTDDLPDFAKRYEAYIGAAPSREGGAVKFHLPLGTTMTLIDARDAAAMLPGTLLPPIPGIAAVVFRTRMMAGLKDKLAGCGFSVSEAQDRLLIPAEEASGVAVMFEG